MKLRNKNAYLAIMMLVVLIASFVTSVITVVAEDSESTAAPSTSTGDATISYAGLSQVKAEAEPYNQNKVGLYFNHQGEKTNSEFAFYFRVKESVVKDSFADYSSFAKGCVVQALYREKKEGLADDAEWKAVMGEYISSSQKTDSATNEEYIYMTVDLYDGGMKNLEAGKTYEIIVEFYEKQESADRAKRCSTNVMEVNYTSEMHDAWRSFFAARAGVTLEEGKVNEKILTGIGNFLQFLMGYVMKFFYSITSNYLISIFLFSLLIKIVMFPTGIKQQKNMVKQAKFAPKQMAIQRKYKGRTDQKTMAKMQEEIREAQMAENISLTGGGCLPMILQMIILISLYGVIRNPLTYMSGVSLDAVNLIKQYFIDLGTVSATSINEINVIGYLTDNFEQVSTFLQENFSYVLTDFIAGKEALPNFVLFPGFNIADAPDFKNPNLLLIIPVLVFLSYYFSMKITRKLSYQPPRMEGTPDMAASMKIMDITMPALSTFICFGVPSMLGIYWIFQSCIGVLQSFILKKMYPFPVYTEADYKKAEDELKAKHQHKKSKDIDESYSEEKKAKSLHIADDDEEYAVLPDKPSVYDLPKDKQAEIKEANEKKANSSNKNSKKNNKKSKTGGLIEKAEIDNEEKPE